VHTKYLRISESEVILRLHTLHKVPIHKIKNKQPLAEQMSSAPRELQNCSTARELACFSSSMVISCDVALVPRSCRWCICDATSAACQHHRSLVVTWPRTEQEAVAEKSDCTALLLLLLLLL